jgi:diguanylate cyclase (GGDEF)-like protein
MKLPIAWRLASLRARLLWLALLVLLPACALSFHASHAQRVLSADRIQNDASRLSRIAAQSLDRLIDTTRQVLVVIAHAPGVRDTTTCESLLNRVLADEPAYLALAYVSVEGTPTCGAPAGVRMDALLEERHVQRALASREFTVGRYSTTGLVLKPNVGVAYPILDSRGAVRGVIVAAMDIRAIGHAIGGLGLSDGADVTVVDSRGTILARYPEEWVGQARPDAPIVDTILTRREGVTEAAGPDGVTRLYAFTPLPSTPHDLFVSIGISNAVAFAEVDQIFYRNLVGLALVGLVAFVGAWVMSNVILVRPLSALLAAAEQLRLGNLQARVDVSGDDEIGALGRAFNQMADQLAATLDAAHQAKEALAQRVQQLVDDRTREVDRLSEMGELLQACLSLDEAYAVVLRWGPQLFPGLGGAVSIISASRNSLETVVAWGSVAGQHNQYFSAEDCWALRRGRTHLVDEGETWLRCRHLAPDTAGYLCIPLIAQGEAVGVLHLSGLEPAGPASRTGERTHRLAETVAEQLSMAFANLKLRETMRTQSILDPLTGLFSRHYMDLVLERELQRSIRTRRPMSVALVNLEHLRGLDATLGQEAGDELLRQFGQLLRNRLRTSDIACRYGDDQIAIILPEALLEDGCQRVDELRDAMRSVRFEYRGQSLGGITFSAGMAGFPEQGESLEVLFKAAEVALYRAQTAGGDRVTMAEHARLGIREQQQSASR